MTSMMQQIGTKAVRFVVLALLAIGTTAPFATAQSWKAHIDWAAGNSNAGGSVDCPGQYSNNGVEYAIVSGGRSSVINQALFDAYDQNFDTAFSLALMTQCHNPGAQQELINSGKKAVLTYLVSNYQPTGIDPNIKSLLWARQFSKHWQ